MLPRLLFFAGFSLLLWPVWPAAAQELPEVDDAPLATPEAVPEPPQTSSFRLTPGARFRDCAECPEMVVIPPGRFLMGSPEDERGHSTDESPIHEVEVRRSFAMGRFEVSFAEWMVCVQAHGCREMANDREWGEKTRPVNNINWLDAQQYVRWLSRHTGEHYRLPSEAEWEYAARAGATTPRYWKEHEVSCAYANVYDVSGQRILQLDWPHFTCIDASGTAAPVGNYLANKFGLHDMLGNVWEWVQDCWNDGYAGAPSDSRPRLKGEGDCARRVLRGGSWKNIDWATRSAFRGWQNATSRVDANGFRVARFSR